MSICQKHGISHSHFLGGPQKWNQLDRDKAVAYEMVMREACPKCGTLAEDWVGDDGIPLADPILAAVMRHCYGCDEIERVQESIPKKARGTFVTLIPFDQLDEDADDWYDPDKDPIEQQKRHEEALRKAPGMGGDDTL